MPTQITLSDLEATALQSEFTSADDTVEAVVHRLVRPILDRSLNDQVATLLAGFKTLDFDTKVSVLTQVQDIATSVTAAKVTPAPVTP